MTAAKSLYKLHAETLSYAEYLQHRGFYSPSTRCPPSGQLKYNMDLPCIEDLAISDSAAITFEDSSQDGSTTCSLQSPVSMVSSWLMVEMKELINVQTQVAAQPFTRLPAEIHTKIAGYCPNRDRLSLCRTSKVLNYRYTTALYENVDLSIRYGDVSIGDISSQPAKEGLREYIMMLERPADEAECRRRQMRFRGNIIRCPLYTKGIRSLKWTLVTDESNGSSADREEPHRSLEDLCAFLARLDSVTEVEVSRSLSFEWTKKRALALPILFPRATSVTLIGDLNAEFTTCLLQGSCLDQLERLRLHNLQIRECNMLYDLCDPTVGFLRCLTGRLKRLKSLEIVDPDCVTLSHLRHYDAGPRYASYLDVLLSVQATLENFAYDQVMDNESDGTSFPFLTTIARPRLRYLHMCGSSAFSMRFWYQVETYEWFESWIAFIDRLGKTPQEWVSLTLSKIVIDHRAKSPNQKTINELFDRLGR